MPYLTAGLVPGAYKIPIVPDNTLKWGTCKKKNLEENIWIGLGEGEAGHLARLPAFSQPYRG